MFRLSEELSESESRRSLSEAQFELLFDSAPEAVVVLDEDGRFLRANTEFTRLFGYTIDEALGRRMNDLVVPEEFLEEARSFRRELVARRRVSAESIRRRKDGSRVPVSILGTPVELPGIPTAAYGIYRDITAQTLLEEQLRQSQKMEAVGRLAGGVAHDFNNVLMVVTGCADLLLGDMASDDPKREDVEQIATAAGRAAKLTSQLLAFGRRQAPDPQLLDINVIVEDVTKMLRHLIGENVETTAVLGAKQPIVRADPNQLQQIIMNLCVNARDAMPTGGSLTIETRSLHITETNRRAPNLSPGDHVMLTVSDTGIGIDKNILSHIFEPFFTTKEPGKGTGLGLSAVYGFLTQAGGAVRVDSEPGQGTTFELYLPCAEVSEPVVQADASLATPESRSETVLLVEDERMGRKVLRRLLEKAGYIVLEATDGVDALRVGEAHPGKIDLLLTDVVMPRMGGPELARKMCAARSETSLLFMSGYSDDSDFTGLTQHRRVNFLQKPFAPEALTRKVREVLKDCERET